MLLRKSIFDIFIETIVEKNVINTGYIGQLKRSVNKQSTVHCNRLENPKSFARIAF